MCVCVSVSVCVCVCVCTTRYSVHFPHVRALCPGVLHLLHTHTHFAGGRCSTSSAAESLLLMTAGDSCGAAAAGVVESRGVEGLGHTIFCASSGQYCAMWLWRYHCRSRDRPEGVIGDGNSSADGAQKLSRSREMWSSCVSDSSLTFPEPGVATSIVKWWYCLMFFSFLKSPVNNVVQLYIGTTG